MKEDLNLVEGCKIRNTKDRDLLRNYFSNNDCRVGDPVQWYGGRSKYNYVNGTIQGDQCIDLREFDVDTVIKILID